MKKRVFVLAAVFVLLTALLAVSAFAADNVRYVADAAKGTGDGLTPETAGTLKDVFTELNTDVFTKAEHAGETCTIYLIEDITLMQSRPGSVPQLAQTFSEHAHENNPVRIETMPGAEKATILFPYGTKTTDRVYNYLLSGETAFDNVIFTTGVRDSVQIPVIAAQGHKLTLGEGVEVRKKANCHGFAVVGITYVTRTLRSKQGETTKTVFHPDVTVLGGAYEYIAAYSYNLPVATGTTAKLTLGNIKVGTLSAANYHLGEADAGVSTEITYVGKVEVETLYPANRKGDKVKAMTAAHVLHKGAELTYTNLDVTSAGASTLNIYFDPTDSAVEARANALLLAWKADANIGTIGFGTMTDLCLADGGHKLDADGKCTVCGVTPCTGTHSEETVVLTESTCALGGLEYKRCKDCYVTLEGLKNGVPDASKHDITEAVWTEVTHADTGKTTMDKVCANCGQSLETYPVSKDGKVAVYLSAKGNARGGESKDNPIDTMRHAQDFAAKLAAVYYGANDKESPVTIYVIGRVDLPSRIKDAEDNWVGNKVSPEVLFSQCFEESKHIDHPFIFKSLDGAERGLLNFLVVATDGTLSNRNMSYMLYGPTTFENISFAAMGGTYEGIKFRERQGHSIMARGFKLVLGNGIEMVDNVGKITINSSNKQVDAAADDKVPVSDIKLFVMGGFYVSGSTVSDCAERKHTDPYDADITVLSGEYWFVGSLNRNVTDVSDTTGTLTIGAPSITYLSAVSTGGTNLTNVTTNIHYRGAAKVKTLYFGTQNKGTDGVTSTYTCNHFFHKGCEKMINLGHAATNRDVLNCYYATNAAVESVMETVTKNVTFDNTGYLQMFCLEHFGRHSYVNDICAICDTADCKGTHTPEWVVDVEATCMTEGHQHQRCAVCWFPYSDADWNKDEFKDFVRDKKIEIDPDNHNYQWVEKDGKMVRVCVNPGADTDAKHAKDKTYQKAIYDGELTTNIYVSDNGFASGGFTAESPLNSLSAAILLADQMATQLNEVTATIYVVGSITVPLAENGTYLEPAHRAEITIMGYGDSAAKFIFSTSSVTRLEYGLNGPTTFDNLEISSGENKSPLYFSGRHHHITMGEKISMDFRRNADGTNFHSGAVTVLGGCYSANFGTCDGHDAHVTLFGGSYRNIILGSSNRSCGLANGKAVLELFGNVASRESIFAGGSGGNIGDVTIYINGDIAVSRYFSFGSSSTGSAKNVRVYLYGGSIISGAFDSNNANAPIGCASTSGSILANKDDLKVYYNPSIPASKEMKNMIQTSANDGKFVEFLLLESVCRKSATGSHSHAQNAVPVDTAPATCYTAGYSVYECVDCGSLYTVEGSKAAHKYVTNAALAKAATCKDAAMTAKTCSECGHTEYTVNVRKPADPNAHVYENGICTVCGYNKAASCNHTYGDLQTETSGCGTTKYKVCKECGYRDVISVTGSHSWGKYTVTVEPTDTAPGVKTRKCKSCGKSETAILYPNDASLATDAIAVDASGNSVDFSIKNSKLTGAERVALNALLQETAYGSEVKVSYTTNGGSVTNVTYSIPVPDAYKDYENVRIVVKDDAGKLHTVDFKIEKGYIVFTF